MKLCWNILRQKNANFQIWSRVHDFKFRDQVNNIFTIKRQLYMWYLSNFVWTSNQVESSHIHHSELEYQQRKGEIRPFPLQTFEGRMEKGKVAFTE